MISYYSPRTNRNAILGSGEATSSLTTQEVGNPTILHEVTHQAAFNRGTTAAAAHRRDGSAKDCQPFWNHRISGPHVPDPTKIGSTRGCLKR